MFLQATHSFLSPTNLDYDLNGLFAIVNELRKSHNTIERYGDKTVDQILTALCELRMTPNEFFLINEEVLSKFQILLAAYPEQVARIRLEGPK